MKETQQVAEESTERRGERERLEKTEERWNKGNREREKEREKKKMQKERRRL